ncbi:hypothetical protein K470DRAFT_259393 [Piedraia hortae CBS 480.64]|uniref:HAM1-like N-terminal domain-containing protein n=1 Tax=Piedraia hortae CBS 480.64 TaxID=1314780 RepID=A0A6A7BW00_9PEZI|nr:hypothetical protein K470DRAFT_259393 [Piedraia hortae CBS 480.64]
MSWCCGRRRRRGTDREPLLPQYAEDTTRQRELHMKLHSYQMLRALSLGYLPSTEQTVINLRTVLAADVLNPDEPELSPSGRRLIKGIRRWLYQFIELLQHKNDRDQLQDMIWFASQSRVWIDVQDLRNRAAKTKTKADARAAWDSLRTVGSLLLTNSDFRVFMSDLNVVAREVFRDAAFTLSNVAEEAGKKLEPSEAQKLAVSKPGADDELQPPDTEELEQQASEVANVVVDGSKQLAATAVESADEKLRGDEGQTMLNRLKEVVVKLRQRNDYTDSVSALSYLIQRYAKTYSRAAERVLDAAAEDTDHNPEMDRALHNAWIFITSFGDHEEWTNVERRWNQLMIHHESDPQFEATVKMVAESLQQLLTDPAFFESAPDKVKELQVQIHDSETSSSLNKDVRAFLQQVESALQSVRRDEDISKLTHTSLRIFGILLPSGTIGNQELAQDVINVLVPRLISSIHCIPVPRLEVSTPDIDLLLENLILEPGHTVNHTSFLPYRLKVETYNDMELRAARFRCTTATTSLMTIKIDGLSLKADDIGFWFRTRSGLLRFADEGLISFAMDERGLDVHLDVEFGKERLENMIELKDVRVHIHKFNYKMRQSKFRWVAFLLKPILRPLLRKTMEHQIASGLADFFHAANREVVFARERLRATRISDPNDLMTFIRAVMARLTPEEDPDLYTRVGVAAPHGGIRSRAENVFAGRYAPGSMVKVWEEQASRARERLDDGEQGGWRNDIFDVHALSMG